MTREDYINDRYFKLVDAKKETPITRWSGFVLYNSENDGLLKSVGLYDFENKCWVDEKLNGIDVEFYLVESLIK